MKKSLVTALIAGAAVLAGAIMLGPQRIGLANQATGDEQLATELAELSVPGHNQLAAMTIEDGVTNYAGWGADNETEVEIGSVTKMLTAELLRHEIDNGAVKLETTLGELIDELADPVASVTLEEAVNHTGGLPRLAGVGFTANLGFSVLGTNPYDGIGRDDVVAAANGIEELENRGEEQYSNLGFALLGWALAENADTTYEEMLHDVLLQPLGMHNTFVAYEPLPDDEPAGLLNNGRHAQPWVTEGYAPAGMVRSTATDMARFAEYLLDKGLPDYGWARTASAQDDNSDTDSDNNASSSNNNAGWHNGQTGGYSSMLVIAPETGRAAFVAGNTPRGVEQIGLQLAGEEVH